MSARRFAMPVFLGFVCAAASHGLSDPKFWILLAVGSLCRIADGGGP